MGVALSRRTYLSTLKDAGDLLKTVLSPRPAAAVVVGAAFFVFALAFLGAVVAEFAAKTSSPVWPLLLIGFLVAVAAGSLVVSAVTSVARGLARVGASRLRQRAASSAERERLHDEAEGARRALDAFLRELTPSERAFLDLFAAQSNTAKEMETGLLPHDVYVANGHLIKERVIERVTSRSDAPYTERYRLLEPAMALVQSIVLNQPVGRREILLDLSKVKGSGASGGGARGSYSPIRAAT